MTQRHILAYQDFIPNPLLHQLLNDSEPVPGVPELMVAKGLQAEFSDIETPRALAFVVALYQACFPLLNKVLEQRKSSFFH